MKYLDLDKEVCKKYQFESLKSLIEEKGIAFFREAENETLHSLDLENSVLATGGGTPCYYNNMDWLKKNGTVIFLNMSEEKLFERLSKTNLSERPLLKNLDARGLKNFIHEKLQERMKFYSKAEIIFDTDKNSVNDLVALLCKSA